MGRRLAFVTNVRTKGELKAGHLDAARVFAVLTRSDLGGCDLASPPPLHDCPSFIEFYQRLQLVLSGWQPEDQLVFYFSGHGNLKNGVYCLQFSPDGSESVPFAGIFQSFRAFGVTRAVIIIDACHSGATLLAEHEKGGSCPIEGAVPEATIPQGIAILASSRISEKSHEMSDEAGSLFTSLFCDGIESGLDGPTTDGLIAVEDIINYISTRLRDKRYSKYVQTPLYKVNGANRSIWLARNKHGAVRVAQPVPPGPVRSLDELRHAYETTTRAKHPCFGARVEDIDWRLVDRYVATARESLREEDSSKHETLTRLGLFSPLAEQGQATLHNAAVLCFCERPERHIPQAASVFVSGSLTGDEFQRTDVFGPLPVQISRLTDLVMANLGTTARFAGHADRVEEPEIPLRVIREIVSNAVVHRDYESSATVQVRVRPEAVEVRSPGGFPRGVSWDTFLSGGCGSYPVDVAVAHYVKNLLVFESVGRGFEIFREHREANGPDSIQCDVTESPPSVLIRVARKRIRERLTNRSGDLETHNIHSHDIIVSTSSGRPTPIYPDEGTRLLSETLAAAQARKRALQALGADTSAVVREILDLKRRMREGGQLKPGDSLADGRYLLLDMLGRGGFAVVWRAHDSVRDENVAVKVLHSNLAGDRYRLERFKRGARIMADLNHPTVVKVLEPYGEDGGWHYFVMEWISGGDLREAVIGGRVNPDQAFSIIIRVCEGIDAAHRRGMVHRDIKPSNILLDRTGSPQITDFDLVVASDTTGGTRTGALGTFVYAAPEQLLSPGEAEATADVYSLAMTLVFALYGSEVPVDALVSPNKFISKLSCSSRVKDVLRRALRWNNAKERFFSAGEFRAALCDAIGARHLAHYTFVSYGGPDTDFAQKLNDALLKNGVTTFFFASDAIPGRKLHRLMREGVNQHDRVILVCSKASLDRPGVLNEITETLQREARDGGKEYLIPITLDDYVFSGWKPEDPGVAQAIRDRVVADFKGAEADPANFNNGVLRLIAALKK